MTGMGELLAYSDDGKLDTTNADSGVRDLLRAYRQVYRQLNLHPSLTTRAVALKATGDEVRPLLKTYWGQHAPFNNRLNSGMMCPQVVSQQPCRRSCITIVGPSMDVDRTATSSNKATPL